MATLKNIRWEAFCQEYMVNGGNAYKAYGVSGYTGNDETNRRKASLLLTKGDIQKRLDEIKKEIEDNATITRGEIIREINEGMVEAKSIGQMSSFMKGLELKGKMIAAFTDKLEQTGAGGKPFTNKLEIEFIKSKEETKKEK